MRAALLLVCVVLAAHAVDIRSAFQQDGFVVDRCIASETACIANSTTSTNLRTGRPKVAFYLQGTPYSWGLNVATLAYPDVVAATGAFLEKVPLALIAPAWIATHDGWAVKELEKIIDYILTHSTVKAFDLAVAAGHIPAAVVEEMQGVVAGAQQMDPATSVTMDKLKAINYGFDVITARIFSGHLMAEILQHASPALEAQLRTDRAVLHELAACDAIGVRKGWVADNYTGFLMRDLQFEMAGVLQDHMAMGVFVPAANASAVASVRVFAPGFVGAFAGVSETGMALGFNTIRSSNSNITYVGINSLLLARHLLSDPSVASLADAVAFFRRTHRGAPFMYPVCDGEGDCAVFEAGRWLPDGEREEPLKYVADKLLREGLLPSASFIEQHACATQSNGVFVRFMNYSYPLDYCTGYNAALWKRYATLPYDAATMTTVGSFVFRNFTENNQQIKILGDRWFMSQVETDPDLVLVSNYGIVPENRLMMMSGLDNYLQGTAEAPVWRYDMMVKLLYEAKKEAPITLDKMVWIADFLAPDRTPGYWTDRENPSSPMSAIIEGVTCVFDLKNRQARAHFGYYADRWIQISLRKYL